MENSFAGKECLLTVRACPEDSKKLPVPLLSVGASAKTGKNKAPGLFSAGPASENSRDAHTL